MQLIRMMTISVISGIIAAGLVWLLWDLVRKLRAEIRAHKENEER
jgi:hypothetical protein